MKIECQVLTGVSKKNGLPYTYLYIPMLEKRIFDISDLEKKVLDSYLAKVPEKKGD